MKKYITTISSNKKIDLSKLTLEELNKLHFEEEKYAAEELIKLKPFSNERIELLKKAYEVIDVIKEYKNLKEDRLISSDKSVEYKLFKSVLKKIKKDNILVLELGCGTCTLLNKIKNIPNLIIYGCDIHENKCLNINYIQDTIYNSLNKFEDGTIDILIADNVCEHFFPDEADKIYELIYKKLSKEGKIIFSIPNIYVGPSDISSKFLKSGQKPLGFHFMEQTYKENIKLFNKHNLYTDYLAIGFKNKKILIKNIYLLDKIKIFFEKIFGSLIFKKALFSFFGYKIYILRK